MGARVWLVGSTVVLLGLGCGFFGAGEPEPEPEPLPIVIPPSVVGTWWQTTTLDDRTVLEWGCDGADLRLELPQGGPVSLQWPDSTLTAELTMAEVLSDATVLLTTADGQLNLDDTDSGLLRAKGELFGLDRGVLFASAESAAVEQIHPIPVACGRELDLSALTGLSEGRYNADGDPCVAAGLSLSLSGSRPLITRSGMEYEIAAVGQSDGGIWVTVQGDRGRLHGMRLVPGGDGSLQVWQRLDTGMAAETLNRIEGLCSSTTPSTERRRKPKRPGPDPRLPR